VSPSLSLGLLLENSLTAIIIIAYLAYETYFGRFRQFIERQGALVNAVVALAREHDNIDEQKVSERVNGHGPHDFVKDDDEEQTEVSEYA
jgi:hypothetical protein